MVGEVVEVVEVELQQGQVLLRLLPPPPPPLPRLLPETRVLDMLQRRETVTNSAKFTSDGEKTEVIALPLGSVP